jgi:hypothetical protein
MWRPISGFNYEVNESGDVRHIKLTRVLTPNSDKDGYKQIGIRKAGERKKHWFRIHRLVAIAFCNPPTNAHALDVDHIDRVVTNNNYSNLRWVTRVQNNANRQNEAWSTNTTTGELYVSRYRNGYMVRINNANLKHRSWHTTLEDAVVRRNDAVAGAV